MSAWLAVGQATTSATLSVSRLLSVEAANFSKKPARGDVGMVKLLVVDHGYTQHLRGLSVVIDSGRVVSSDSG